MSRPCIYWAGDISLWIVAGTAIWQLCVLLRYRSGRTPGFSPYGNLIDRNTDLTGKLESFKQIQCYDSLTRPAARPREIPRYLAIAAEVV